jgi:hypothetical protein
MTLLYIAWPPRHSFEIFMEASMTLQLLESVFLRNQYHIILMMPRSAASLNGTQVSLEYGCSNFWVPGWLYLKKHFHMWPCVYVQGSLELSSESKVFQVS